MFANKINKEDKKEKKKARGALLLFLKKLRKTCGKFKSAQEWYKNINDFLNPILSEYEKVLPANFVSGLKSVTKLTDTTQEGIIRSCGNLQMELEKVINILPKGAASFSQIILGGLVVGAITVGVLTTYLNAIAIKIIIKNQGCSTIKPPVYLPIKIPGLVLPIEPIFDGGEIVAKVPKVTIIVDGSEVNMIKLGFLGFNINFKLDNSRIDLIFDDTSLLGKRTKLNLGSQSQHILIIRCNR